MTKKSEDQVVYLCTECKLVNCKVCTEEQAYIPHSQYLALKSDLAVAVEGLKDVVEIWENDCKGSGPDTMTGEWLYNKAKEALERIGVK